MEIVDAYVHCGLRKYEPIENVRRVAGKAGVKRAVLVQHLGEFDNSYIGGIVADNPECFAGVCLIDHAATGATETLELLASSGNFKGIRLVADTLTRAPGLWKAAVEQKLVILLYAPEGIAACVNSLKDFLSANHECRLVIAHLGISNILEVVGTSAYKRVFELAQYPGVRYQISGMKMFCPYPHEELYPVIAEAFGHFGVSRLIWGSNYPVVGGEQDYINDLNLLLDGKLPIPNKDIADIVGGNSQKFWFPQT